MAIVRTKTQYAMLGLGLALLFSLPAYIPADWVVWLILLGISTVAVLGLHLMTGLCGQFSIGQAAFVAVGAYTTAVLTGRYDFSPWATLPLSGIVAGLAGLVFATPALRIKGFYLVMATIAAQFVIVYLLREWSWTGGLYGMDVSPISIAGHELGDQGFAWLTIGIVVIMIIAAKNIQRTSTGRKFIAVRDNDLAAQVSGVNLFQMKLLAFFIGCFFAGIAGWLWAHFFLHITPIQFTFEESIWYLGMLIVGGMGSTAGAVLGVALIELLEKLVDYLTPLLSSAFPSVGDQMFSALSLIIFGGTVVLFVMLNPRGISHWIEQVKAYYRLYPFAD